MNAKLISTAEAAKLVPSNPSAVAVWRWMRHGVKARSGAPVHLKHYRFGGKLYTTEDDLQKFSEELAKADSDHFDRGQGRSLPPAPARRSESKREHELSLARKRLKSERIA